MFGVKLHSQNHLELLFQLKMKFLLLILVGSAVCFGLSSAMLGPFDKDFGYKRFRIDTQLEGGQPRESKDPCSMA